MVEVKYDIDNTYIHYIKFGTGKKVLAVLSGISLLGFEGQGSLIENQYKLLKDEYTIYIFDRRRYLEEETSIYDLAEDVYSILKEEKVEKASIVGISQGGMIGLAMANMYPSFVEKLMIVSSSAYGTEISKKNWEKCREYIKANDVYNMNMFFYEKVYTEGYFKKYERAFKKLAEMGSEDDMKRFNILLDMMDAFDIRNDLNKIKCPTYVIGAGKDEIFGLDASKELAEALKVGIYIYEDYGHACYDESTDFVQRVSDFLK